jgi:aryl-alcohol dehydrogenase-like predicted oxidoreductase
MTKLNRRDFVSTSIAGAGALTTASCTHLTAKEPSANDHVALGQTGITVSKLAMGTGMRGTGRGSNQTRLGQEKFTHLMQHGFEHGINFFDMADFYGSHPFVREALKDLNRDQYVLLSKIWFRSNLPDNDPNRAIPNIDRFRKELDTDMIDIVLVHCVTNPRWPEQQKQMLDEMAELKEKGVVRAIGCSCHSLEALRVAAELPWVDVILARINNQQKKMDADPATVSSVLLRAKANGKGIIGMKIYGEGTITDEEERFNSMKYVIDNNLVDTMTIGFEQIAHVDNTVGHLKMIYRA